MSTAIIKGLNFYILVQTLKIKLLRDTCKPDCVCRIWDTQLTMMKKGKNFAERHLVSMIMINAVNSFFNQKDISGRKVFEHLQ